MMRKEECLHCPAAWEEWEFSTLSPELPLILKPQNTRHLLWLLQCSFLRYGWTPSFLPTNCICVNAFSVDHALSCNRGTFLIHHHNNIRDLTAGLLLEVCHNICLEPELQRLDNESFLRRTTDTDDYAWLDISTKGFWKRSVRAFLAFFDI